MLIYYCTQNGPDEMHAMPQNFLLELARCKLPLKVSDPKGLRMVCVLTSTGLIESESWPRLSMTERFRPVKYAWVERITDEGFAEIASIQSRPFDRADTAFEATWARPATAVTPIRVSHPVGPVTPEIARVPRTSWIASVLS
ncbi:hypothetical protein [Variovorax sp. tm]|uniref:hypothetical protein n=1 Tax=Variovorax atrisoli TaxID=3394203 RepID=UPI003A7F7F89